MLNIPATVSITVAVVGLTFALLTFGLSFGPGWRASRSFALSAFLGAAYSPWNLATVATGGNGLVLWSSRISIAIFALWGCAFYRYTAVRDNRRLSLFERAMVVLGATMGFVSLIPGVSISNGTASRHVAWLGVTYTDAIPTTFGDFAFVFFIFGCAVLVTKYAARWRSGERGAAAHVIGLSFLTVTSTIDCLSAARVIDAPYVIDIGFFVLVLSVGTELTLRVIREAHDLDTSSRKLVEAQADLVKSERLAALGEMAAVVAHEVRNPVGVIFNATATLRRLKPDSPEAKEMLRIVEEEASRLKRMVSEFLEFARPRKLHRSETRLVPIVLSAIQAACADNETDAVELSAETDAVVTCDEQLLRQAVMNLVSNALQSRKRRSPVRVGVTATDGEISIAVADDGEGVPKDLASRIFEPFFTTRPRGTGLGLPLVQRVAEAHAGSVSVMDTPGGGATFVLTIPIVQVEPLGETDRSSHRIRQAREDSMASRSRLQ